MVALLQKLTPGHAILLVEHDMDAVFAVADLITVMVDGQVLESGPPAQIRSSAAVRQAYLGDGVDA
jgi:branched-chain amino acid transport system ATP-binding protein